MTRRNKKKEGGRYTPPARSRRQQPDADRLAEILTSPGVPTTQANMSEAEPQSQTLEGDGSLRAAYFFIPLTEHIGIPHKTTFPVYEVPSFEEMPPAMEMKNEDGYLRFMRLSFVVHQVDHKGAGFERVTAALLAAGAAFPTLGGTSTPKTTMDIDVTSTVFEAMCILDPSDPDPVSDAFDRAVEEIRRFQRKYYAMAEHSVKLISLKNLPVMIPYGIRELVPGEAEPSWPESLNMLMVNPGPSAFGQVSRPILDEHQLTALFEIDVLDDAPFESFLDLKREAQLAIEAGNTLPASILLGAATENLLREIFLIMLWDEDTNPGAAANLTRHGRTITDLARTEFHNRLGGNWSQQGSGPVAQWSRCVKDLRNRVVHSGYIPTSDELSDASGASTALSHFVGDRLGASFKKLPLSAWLYLGTNGFEKRRLSSKWDAYLQDNVVPTDTHDSYRCWKREVERHRLGGPFEGTAIGAELLLVTYEDGSICWWIHDPESKLSTLAQAPEDLSIAQQDLIRSLTNDPATQGREVSIRLASPSVPETLESAPTWVPTAEVIPPRNLVRHPTPRINPTAG